MTKCNCPADSQGIPVAVPDQIFDLALFLDLIDRCHSLPSLLPPPAAFGSLPSSKTGCPQYLNDSHMDHLLFGRDLLYQVSFLFVESYFFFTFFTFCNKI